MKFTNKDIISKAIDFAKPYYELPHRINGYHSWTHIREGFSLYQKHFENEIDENHELLFYIAWIFHDIVYIGSSQNNEEESEQMFKLFCTKNPDLISEKQQNYISQLILCTKKHTPIKTEEDDIRFVSKIINDIDQAYLGYDFVNFMRKRQLVRNDFCMYSDEEYKEGSILFSYSYLTQDFTFFTEKFQNIFQNNVFYNLDKYIYFLKQKN